MANICPRKKTPESPIMKERFTIIKFTVMVDASLSITYIIVSFIFHYAKRTQ